jgi:DNA polymerase-3 subunit beta
VSRLLESTSEVTLVLGEHDVAFELAGLRVSTRLIEDDFPDYAKLIPDAPPARLTVGRQSFIDALKRVKLVAQEHTPVRLTMEPDLLRLRATSNDLGEALEELDAKYEGAELEVAFNPEYLLQGLEVTAGDEVMLETESGSRPAMLRSVDRSDFLYLLMPVRVS